MSDQKNQEGKSDSIASVPTYWQPPYGEPDWVTVPAGKFWMGEGEKLHQVELPDFQISKTPVTNGQYDLFIKATDRHFPRLWEYGTTPVFKKNHPVVYMTWFDAIAYCEWLSDKIGKHITLPSEAEWEKAARGSQDQRIYPWGNQFNPAYCNTAESNKGDTSIVGRYPDGRSPYGVLDMCGNVWEWTRTIDSLWDEQIKTMMKEFVYPYIPEDGREEITKNKSVSRIVRGGSFHSDNWQSRCIYRQSSYPDFKGYDLGRDIGFRVVVSPL